MNIRKLQKELRTELKKKDEMASTAAEIRGSGVPSRGDAEVFGVAVSDTKESFMQVKLEMSLDELRILRAAIAVTARKTVLQEVRDVCVTAADQLDHQIYPNG